MSEEHEFTTQNLALAATLLLNEYSHDRLEHVEGGCQWVYTDPSEEMMSLVEDFRTHQAWVDPIEFVLKLGLVRREMYNFLGHKAKSINS